MLTSSDPYEILSNPKGLAKHLRQLLDAHSSRTRFGRISRATLTPMHRNTRNNPLPIFANGARRPDSNGPKKTLDHLYATKENRRAIFHVNRPDAPVMLLAADWDCSAEAEDGPARAAALARVFDVALGGRTFVEPSRNRRGRYNWLLVRPDEQLEVFVERVKGLNRTLSLLYGRAKDNDGVGFDAIKGVPWRASPNPLYRPDSKHIWHCVAGLNQRNAAGCPDFIDDPSEMYRWHRSHYANGRFERIEALEEQLLHFGSLVTQPLCGLFNDDDGGTGRWDRFLTWYHGESAVIASSDLWARFPHEVDPPRLATDRVQQLSGLRPASRDGRQPRPEGCDVSRPWVMLRNSEDVLESMNGAALLTIRHLGIAAVSERPDEAASYCLGLYAEDGAGTDGNTPGRLARARESLLYFVKTFDPTRRSKVRFSDPEDVQDAGTIVDTLLADEALREFNAAGWSVDSTGGRYKKARTYVGRPLLHRAYCCVLTIIVTQDGGLSIAGLQGLLRELGTGCSGSTLKVTLSILVNLGLIRCIDSKYRFFAPKLNGGEKIRGQCRQWSIAADAPLPDFIVPFVPHVVDQSGRAVYCCGPSRDSLAAPDHRCLPIGGHPRVTARQPAPCPSPLRNTVFDSGQRAA